MICIKNVSWLIFQSQINADGENIEAVIGMRKKLRCSFCGYGDWRSP
jgi:hypothetical protein